MPTTDPEPEPTAEPEPELIPAMGPEQMLAVMSIPEQKLSDHVCVRLYFYNCGNLGGTG